MNAKDLVAILPAIIHSRVSALIWGYHGQGKSQIVRQVVHEMYGPKNLDGSPTLIDLRLGQMEIGDLTGIPRNVTTDGVTRTIWGIPQWWPNEGTQGVLFLDELNRASTQDVLQASFQLVLDYKLHTHTLPSGWSVIAAANPDNNEYQVLRLDPALMNRFLHISFSPTLTDWRVWSAQNMKTRLLREFVEADTQVLGLKSPPDLGIVPTPRSVEMLDRVLQCLNEDQMANYGYMIASGLLGPAFATTFRKYMTDNMDKPVAPEILLNDWDAALPVIKKWLGTKKSALRLVRADLLKAQFSTLVAYMVTELNSEPTDIQLKNFVKFLNLLPTEIGVAGLHEMRERNATAIIEKLAPHLVGTPTAKKWAKILQTGDMNMNSTGTIEE